MADEKKFDPFKPAQPQIPGVPQAAAKDKAAAPKPAPPAIIPEPPAAPKPIPWRAVAAVVGVLTVGGLLYWAHTPSSKSQTASSETAEASQPAAEEPRKPAEKPLTGPGPIATTDELAKPWSAKRFLFRGPASTEAIPALVVRLPGGDYWGLSLREPFGTCDLEYVTDLQKLKTDYNFSATHPVVGNTCSHAVYDLTRYGGGAPNGGLVRGDIVAGAGVRPPLAIEIRVEGKQVRAVRME
jgi:hypothetical protein